MSRNEGQIITTIGHDNKAVDMPFGVFNQAVILRVKEDTDQIVGVIDGKWWIASDNDSERISQMAGLTYRIGKARYETIDDYLALPYFSRKALSKKSRQMVACTGKD